MIYKLPNKLQTPHKTVTTILCTKSTQIYVAHETKYFYGHKIKLTTAYMLDIAVTENYAKLTFQAPCSCLRVDLQKTYCCLITI